MEIDGQRHDVKSFTIKNNDKPTRVSRPYGQGIVQGRFEVSGTITCHFQNPALLDALVGRPHKAAVWERLRRPLYRVVTYLALATTVSMIAISGAY